MKRNARAKREQSIRAFVQLDAATERLISSANFDLYNGPTGADDDYPGFVKACRQIRAMLADVDDLYVDEQSGEVFDTEPLFCDGCDDENCTGEDFGDWYHYERRDVLAILVGKELVFYIR